MSDKREGDSLKELEDGGIVRKCYLLIAFMALIILSSMVYVYHTGNRLAAVHAPLVDAAMEIKLQATSAHLWLMEILTDDDKEDINTVTRLIDEADWYAEAMLEGGENSEGKFYPLDDTEMRAHIEDVRTQLAVLRVSALQRWEERVDSVISNQADQEYDSLFDEFITQADNVETDLQILIAKELKYFKAVQSALIIICLVVTLAAGKIVGSLLRTQVKDKEALKTTNQQLDATNQLLNATNQQLSANEQQLRAINQQLSANEQQLRAANQQLTVSEGKYRDLFNEMTSGLATHEIICDDKGKAVDYRFIEVNPAFEKLMGLNAEDIIGKTVLEVIPGTESYWIEKFGKVALTGKTISFDNYSTPLKRHYHVNAFSQQKGYFAAIFSDVTKLKNAEIEQDKLNKMLAVKNKELQSVVYIASHDLRSPLVNIQGFSSELIRSCESLNSILKDLDVDDATQKQIDQIIGEDISECLKFITSSTGLMQMQLDGLLQVSRVGSAELEIEKLGINNLMKNILQAMEFQIQQSDVEIIVSDMPDCLGDLRQTNQIFTNLIDNALKYSHPDRKGKVTITSECDDNMIHYYVEDNGIGVKKEHQDKVFEMFHRLNPSDTVGGQGLGLAIVKRMVQRQHGQISVESEEGVGCKFCVSLPKA